MWIAIVLGLIALPLVELALLIKIAQWLGFWWMVGLIVITALVGVAVMQRQGAAAAMRALEAQAQGRPPVEPVIDGAFIMLAGGLLLAPGVITDVAGGLLLVPVIRRAVARRCLALVLGAGIFRVDVREYRPGPGQRPGDAGSGDGSVIEGEYTRLGERPVDPDRDKHP